MRIIFFGTSEFAVPSLEAVAEHVVLAVSQPDRPTGRGLRVTPSPVSRYASRLGIPLAHPQRCRSSAFIAEAAELDADFLLVAAYGQILPDSLFAVARHGGINVHGSLLPEYRGAAPIQRCLLAGRATTGTTLMQMDTGLDTGDIIAMSETTIEPEETAAELLPRLATLGADLVAEWAERLAQGTYPRTPQDHTKSSQAPKVSRNESVLSTDRDAVTEFNRYRAFTTAPGATLGNVLIHRASLRKEATGEPGTVVGVKPELVVAFASGGVALLEVQAPGKRRISGRDYANGARLALGMRFMP